jgi:hypothetical protein
LAVSQTGQDGQLYKKDVKKKQDRKKTTLD